MKIKKLISSALVFVMLFTTMIAVIPVSSSAAEDAVVEKSVKQEDPLDGEVIQAIISDYRLYGSAFTNKNGEPVAPFTSARDALNYELKQDYLDWVKYADSAVYVNRYTGLMFYENLVTGQILMSNPYDPAYQTKEGGVSVSIDDYKLSQIELQYFEAANTANKDTFNNIYWIYENGKAPIVSGDGDGISITYTLGSAIDSFVAPGAMLYSDALKLLITPIFNSLAAIMEQECGKINLSYDVFVGGVTPLTSYNAEDYVTNGKDLGLGDHYRMSEITDFINAMSDYVDTHAKKTGTAVSTKASNYIVQVTNFFNRYEFVDPAANPNNNALGDIVSAFGEGKVIMLMKGAGSGDVSLTSVRIVDKALRVLMGGAFDKAKAEECETACGYTPFEVSVPRFDVTVNYSLDENGDLIVSIPTNAITYDSSFCSLKDIAPLKHFGAGDMDKEGYLFFPDGSGAIVEFDDFYFGSTSDKTNMAITLGDGVPMYGSDYCYAEVTGQHREQLVMPVYGLVNETNSSGEGYSSEYSTVTNGFFAIIEEGSALASLTYLSGGGTHKYISVYSTFAPFPSDTYNLSQSISVSGLGSYTIASEARYDGAITTRYSMLVDHDIYAEATAADSSFVGYAADYVGMATRYREYLESTGVISQIAADEILPDLPLYIEALGSVDVVEKILSFPVTVSQSLTTFEDVEKMYRELSNAIDTLKKKAADYEAQAAAIEAEEHPELRQDEIDSLKASAKKFRELADQVVDIKNINFKLTGFANGGMHSTYPAKLKWESSVGGKKGFRKLIDSAAELSTAKDSNFGLYPDFDFMYINNTEMFDGIGRRGTAACMVDNRYASKQSYNSVKQEFESLFALVVSSGSFDKLFTKFDKKYSAYGNNGLSVSTLASDLNSDFDKKKPLTREDSLNNVTSLMSKMADKYSLMGDKGNVYTLKYLDHVLRAPIDSSHYNVISYTVPFYGMVLHGYINYAGTPLNYSGSPEYDMLRAIENGASLYYILCMENTNYLKEDPLLSDYFGVDYNNWFEKIVAQYKNVNTAIGDLQGFKIVDHTKILAERVIGDEEIDSNYLTLIEEFCAVVDEEISKNVDAAIKELRKDPSKIGAKVKFTVSDEDLTAILDVFADRVNLSVKALCEKYNLDDAINGVIADYAAQYSGNAEDPASSVAVTLTADDVKDYKTKYEFITDSYMSDDNYVRTDYTCDNGNVVMVIYEGVVDGNNETVVFILNYNVFSVKVKLDGIALEKLSDKVDADGYLTLDKYGYVRG